ncbi:MAG: hypothetical protein IJD33_04805, partial [Clostridia bacterium]|nr:hypothetical protein [Clostridia bacterium]
TYGGTLTFLCAGGQYRVERIFGKTPTQDIARVYDKNNMQCFDFGERAERLGEILFGVNADSYRRSVYIPQGEIETAGISDDIKTRLLALLSNGGKGETSAERALQKLDEAERKLRAKRRPAKGKLDEIDERLDEIARLKSDADGKGLQAKQLRAQAAQAEQDILYCNQELEKIEKQIELSARRNELTAAKDMQGRLASAREELSALRAFFKETDPSTLNVEGLQVAVDGLYQWKDRLRTIERQLAIPASGEEGEIRARIAVCEKTLGSYDEILSKQGGKPRKEKGKKIVPKVTRRKRWLLILSVTIAMVGAALANSMLAVGLSLLGAGALGMLVGFFSILPRYEKLPKSGKDERGAQDEIARLYDETYAELTALKKRLAILAGDNATAPLADRATVEQEYADLQEKISAKEESVESFLRNFAFGEIYDYRSALRELRDKIERYLACEKDVRDYENRLQGYSAEEFSALDMQTVGDVSSLKAKKQAWSEKKDELLNTKSECLTRAENLETQFDKAALFAEESVLQEEKVRLEKRYRAILAAREILWKAKENMAARYLDPVERGCRYYLGVLGGAEQLRFAADGTPVYEEKGAFRPMGYYSVGSKELVGICTRIALADAVFKKETPVLILDDPFVNLDDMRTERAKAFVRELSKRYQILYLTCKTERKI